MAVLVVVKVCSRQDEDNAESRFKPQEFDVLIQSVELVALPNAPAYQEKVYRARLANGALVDLFQVHWDVPLPMESLIGMSVPAARQMRNERMLAVAQGQH